MIISNDIYLIFDMIDFPKWIKISDDIFTNRQCRYKPDKFHDLHIDSPNLYTWKCKYSYEIALEKTLKEFNITRNKYETTKQFYESDEVDYLKKCTITKANNDYCREIINHRFNLDSDKNKAYRGGR